MRFIRCKGRGDLSKSRLCTLKGSSWYKKRTLDFLFGLVFRNRYDSSFNKISEKYFKQTPWPSSQAIAPLVENDQVFGLLYNELCYRHIYARLQPSLEQQCESWDNYCALYHVILSGHVNMQLPNQWLWDMIDEFIYQVRIFQIRYWRRET